MSREHYIQALQRLQEQLVKMGALVADALRRSLVALQHYDAASAAAIVAGDAQIDALQRQIETDALQLMALQQPVARDLRLLASCIAIAGELERMGDYAKGIAKRVRRLTGGPRLLPLPSALEQLGEVAEHMLAASITAFVNQDAAAAQRLALIDEEADRAEEQVFEAVRQAVTADGNCFEAGQAVIDVAHALERVADRATNIAERVVYLATSATESLNP